MRLLLAYDSWCIARLLAVIVWLNEWLSIPQKRLEQSLIGIYCGLMSGGLLLGQHKTPLWLRAPLIGTYVFIGFTMYWLHRKPAVLRKWAMTSRLAGIGRVAMQMFLGCFALVCVLVPPRVWSDWGRFAAQIAYIVFYYLIDITTDGEPGRKRKLALKELKKMFGAEWIPKPLAVPW